MHRRRRLIHSCSLPARSAGRVLLGLLLGSVACGDDSSTEPNSGAPTKLLAVSPVASTALTGEPTDPPISVQVVNSRGLPVEGIPVRFLIVSGPGRLDPMAISDSQGIAEAEFVAGSELGEARIRTDIPSATNVSSLQFTVTVIPAASVSLEKEGGDEQQAEGGSQLPLPFVLRVTTPAGAPAGGMAIAWRVASPEATDARLTADTTYTDSEGVTQVLLTLGSQATGHIVLAHAAGGVGSDTVRFTATATAVAGGSIQLDSIRPLPLRAGEEAVVFGNGFEPSMAANEVRVEGESAEIVEASVTTLRFQVPKFTGRCLPAREVGVRVLVGGQASNGSMELLEPTEPFIDLAPGEALTLVDPERLACLQFAGSTTGEFWLGVQSASHAGEAATPLRLLMRAGAAGPPARISPAEVSPALTAAQQMAIQEERGEGLLRENVWSLLARRHIAPARAPGRDTPRQAALARISTEVGDTLHFFFAVQPDLQASCADTTNRVAAIVTAVRDGVVLAVDADAPAGDLTDADWAVLADEFDRTVLPTELEYFGSPMDIDANGRIVLLFTPEVNRLTPLGAGTFIGGFFLALDLAASGQGGGGVPAPDGELCPASNEAEIIYAAVPDPGGAFGDILTTSQFRRIVRELMPHELQHLINAQGRVLVSTAGFGAREESWLDEGLSHLAEEVTGLRLLNAAVGQNLTFEDVASTRAQLDLFNAFHIVNFFNSSLFMFDPTGTPALATTDPGGLQGAQLRGRSWLFLRWLGDQEGGGDQRDLFRELASGGPAQLTGVSNVEQVTGVRWEQLLADFVATLPLDDGSVPPVSDRHRVLTWNLRDVFASLNSNPSSRSRFPLSFPLALTRLRFENAAADFELSGSTIRYFRLQGGIDVPALAVSLLSPGGAPAPAGAAPQITIVRTR